MGKKKSSADDYSVENFVKFAKENIKGGAKKAVDDIHYMMGTKRGKNIEDSLDEKYPYRSKGYSKGGVTMRGYGKARAGNKCKIY